MKKLIQLFTAEEKTKKELSPFLEKFLLPKEKVSVEPFASQWAPCAQIFSPNHYFFCQQNIDLAESVKHGVVVSLPGGGKTAFVIKPLLKALLPGVRLPSTKKRRIIY